MSATEAMAAGPRNTSGSRRRLPGNALSVCAYCLRPLPGKRSRGGWVAILRPDEEGQQRVIGWTCPDCPTYDEPITTVDTKGGRRFVASARDVEGRTRAKRFTRLDEAREWVAERRAEAADGRRYDRDAESETVEHLVKRWLDGRVDVRDNTVEGYEYALRPIVRRIGDQPARSLTAADVQRLIKWLSKSGGKPSKAHPHGKPLGSRSINLGLIALAQALDLLDLPVNPARHRAVRRPRKVQKVGTDLEHWPTEGRGANARCPAMERFREAADADPLAGAWRLSLCGLTRADVCGLRWTDVGSDAGLVTVRQGRTATTAKGGGSRVDEPKSAQRRRTVPVDSAHPGTTALLRKLRADQAQARLVAGAAWHDSGFVVVDELGVPLRPEVYSDRFRRLCKAAGVPVIKLHSIRHSLAFLLLARGVLPMDAAALLGHTTEVFLSTYLPEAGSSGAARAAEALGGGPVRVASQ